LGGKQSLGKIQLVAMRLPVSAVAATLVTAACATVPRASLEDRTLTYGCNDTVVVGAVTNGAYEPVHDNDILGHGWISATLHVRNVVRGAAVPANLPVRYFAHTYMRQDQEFMLVLKHSSNGYEITAGQAMRMRPVLASHCE
jgi:hypothetical protein